MDGTAALFRHGFGKSVVLLAGNSAGGHIVTQLELKNLAGRGFGTA